MILPKRKCALTWKGGNRMVPSPGYKPDVVATSLHQILTASVAFFWKYEAWHYVAWTTHGFCWLMRSIFLLKLCTFDQIVHSVIQNSSPCSLVHVQSEKHHHNSTKCRALPLFQSFCVLPQVVRVARNIITELICLDYVDRSIFCHMLQFIGRNAGPGDMQKCLYKFSHVLLFVSL